MKTKKHHKKILQRLTAPVLFFVFAFLFLFVSCSNNNNNVGKRDSSKMNTILPPAVYSLGTDTIKNPILVIVDTCPKPQVISTPSQPTNRGITLKNGKLLKLAPPQTKAADFISLIQTYTVENGLALDAISCAIMDKWGNLWFGTYGGGVSRYDGKSFTNFTTAQGLANNVVRAITQDKAGNLWFGTDGGGVSRYDGKSFTNFTTDQGLANNRVWSITQDKAGNLWFGTDGGGVSRYDAKCISYPCFQNSCSHDMRVPQDLEEHNKELSNSFTNFTTGQGLAFNAVLTITQDKTGNLWFGTDGGGVSRYNSKRADFPCNTKTCIHDLRLKKGLEEHNKELAKAFTNYTTIDGLANNVVVSILQDNEGNMWFAMDGGGVSRLDAKRASYPCVQNSCRHDMGIQRDFEEHKKELAKSFTNYTIAQGLAHNVVYCISKDKTGNLWFGTYGGGVSLYDVKRANNPCNTTTCKHDLRNKNDLEAHNLELAKCFTNFTTAQGLASNRIWSITQDNTGNLWFGTDGGGVSRYDGKSLTNYTTAQGLANNVVLSIAQDRKGNLWFGTDGGGVSRYDGNRIEAIENGETIPISEQQDLIKINGKLVKSFTNYTAAQGLVNNYITSITQDKAGNIWFGSHVGGASCYNGNSFTNFTTDQGLANNVITSIVEDRIGNIWIATDGGGVSRYDGLRVEAIERGEPIAISGQKDLKRENGKLVKTFTNFTVAQGLVSNRVWCIAEDKSGNLWFGTTKGVSRYDGNRVEAIESGEYIPINDQQDLKKVKGKLVKSFTNYTTSQGLANNCVWNIMQDKKGNLWFAADGGVSLLPKEELDEINRNVKIGNTQIFENYTKEDALPDNSVTNVVESNDGNIFLGTNNGICELVHTPSSPKAFAVAAIYNSSTGYPIKDVNFGQNAMFKDNKGIIWMGTGSDKTALARFDYTVLNKNTKPLPVFIQAVQINNENIGWYSLESQKLKAESHKFDSSAASAMVTEEVTKYGKVLSEAKRDSMKLKFGTLQFDSITKFNSLPVNLVLPYEHNHITFEFTAVEPDRPYLVKYQYTLEGLDKEWSPAVNKTSAEFGNLWEGTYTLKLKAQSPFGVWSEPITYTFKVLPPWWRTWWMYALYVFVFVSLGWIYIKWRERNLQREKAILETKVEQRTEQLQKANTEISEQKKVVEEKQKEIVDSINYAKRIQSAKLPDRKEIQNAFPNSFVLFKPKDIVSGDFYYFYKSYKLAYIASADCTGHGVPGAFMSMIGSEKLDEALVHNADPSQILSHLNKGIKSALKQSDSDDSTRDGMDIALCSVDVEERIVRYAGANRPIWIIRKDQSNVEEIKATKKAIGGLTEDSQHFDTHEIHLQPGDCFYISTDGYADTFGGHDSKKLTTKRFKEILLSIQNNTMKEQEQYLDKYIEDWKAGTEQIDDILVIGVRL